MSRFLQVQKQQEAVLTGLLQESVGVGAGVLGTCAKTCKHAN